MHNNSFPTTTFSSSDDFKSAGTFQTDELRANHLIKAEVNLLRLPFFALQTKSLRGLDGFECTGTVSRNGHKHQYHWRVTRHATYSFPGPLARAAHLAFLDIMTERGLPFRNPVVWKWRDLCRRMDIAYSGRTVQRLKEAIRATHGVIIESSHAIYSKSAGELVELDEDDRHLYARVHFSSRKKQATGETSDENQVWLSTWYLDSLNAHYTAPLDHDLWLYLDKHSPIASRFYEYLLPVFYRPVAALAINYRQLAQSLPVRQERYFSDAQKQLDPALALLVDAHVLNGVEWNRRPSDIAQLRLHRGDQLAAAGAIKESHFDVALDQQLEVREIRNRQSPEERLVIDFYRQWMNRKIHRPSRTELDQAHQIIAAHGPANAASLIPVVVRLLKLHWPDAKTFAAVVTYLPDAVELFNQQELRRNRQRTKQLQQTRAEQQRQEGLQERQKFNEAWEPVWKSLSATEQTQIEDAVVERQPWLRRTPSILHQECLKQLQRRVDRPADGGETLPYNIANGGQHNN